MAQHRPNMPHNRAHTGPIWMQHRPHVAQHGPSTAKHRANMGPTYPQHTPNIPPTWALQSPTYGFIGTSELTLRYGRLLWRSNQNTQNTSKYHAIQIQCSFPSSFSEVLDISHSHPTRAEWPSRCQCIWSNWPNDRPQAWTNTWRCGRGIHGIQNTST